MRAIIYEDETGKIVRSMSGSVPIENQRLNQHESILTDSDADIPETAAGKMVDTSKEPPQVVDDPEYISDPDGTVKRSKVSGDSLQEFKDADDSRRIEILYEIVTGETPP